VPYSLVTLSSMKGKLKGIPPHFVLFLLCHMLLDLRGIATKQTLHGLFKAQLGFPEWYGASWDAFWDCVVAIVVMPECL